MIQLITPGSRNGAMIISGINLEVRYSDRRNFRYVYFEFVFVKKLVCVKSNSEGHFKLEKLIKEMFSKFLHW